MSEINTPTLSKENENDLLQLKQYFPYRIIFGVILPDGSFEAHAEYNKRKLNKFLKTPGCTVYMFQ